MADQEPKAVMVSREFISDVTVTKNMHAASWLELLFEARKECLENQSTDQTDVHEADVNRVRRCIEEIRDHQEWAQQRPQLDLPHSKNRQFEIRFVGLEADTSVQNRFWRDAARLIDYAINEAQEGESIRVRSGLNTFDVERVNAILDDLEELLTRAVDFSPMDKPAVYPSEADGSPGSQNSNPEYSETIS
jgi:hypothetical protein